MMVMQEVTQPANADFSIWVARSSVKDLISMLNASFLSVWKAPACSLLQVINNQFLIMKNLLLLASRVQL